MGMDWLCPFVDCYCTDVKAVVVSEACDTEYHITESAAQSTHQRIRDTLSAIKLTVENEGLANSAKRRITSILMPVRSVSFYVLYS